MQHKKRRRFLCAVFLCATLYGAARSEVATRELLLRHPVTPSLVTAKLRCATRCARRREREVGGGRGGSLARNRRPLVSRLRVNRCLRLVRRSLGSARSGRV